MNSKAIKPIVLVVVFIGALITFSVLTNKVNTDTTTTMEDATLPVMQFVYEDTVMNELHGYVQEMDMLSMRDGLMPIGENRVLNLEILTYGNEIDNLSYKIRSMDSESLLVDVEDADITVNQDKVECSISLPSLFADNQEYNMEIVLTAGEQKIYYYTRVIRANDCYVDECLEFALQFHEYTFRDDANSFITTYMDPATGDATNLSYVDLSCTLNQITWGNFTGEKWSEPVVSFQEINSSYNVITIDYVMTNVNENNEVEYYNVEEYYRLRQTSSRMYVLNFERTMNQIFRYENDFLLGNSGILLGIRDNDVEYAANESGDCIAFVQEGELWCYNRVSNTISQVFSFRGAEGIDNRENWDEHDIEIIRVDEAGSITFVVSGYMNRGEHEGQVGIGVYYYDGISYTVEEKVFIPSDKSYGVLQAELGNLMYVNEQKEFYFMLSDNIYKIDMTSFTAASIVESDTDACYAVSNSGRYLAWIEPENLYSSDSIHLEDLKTGISYQITSGENTYVQPIAFIGEDFVYGAANSSDITYDAAGNLVFPMSKIEILNTSDDKTEVIKTYLPKTGKIGTITVDANNIYVELISENNGQYTSIGSDTIMNREADSANGISLTKSVTDLKQTQVAISMKEISSNNSTKVIVPKQILLEEERVVSIDIETEGYYYVYVKGDVLLATKDASEAVRCANEKYGVAVDSNLRYIFKRERNSSQTPLTNLSVNETDASASSMVQAISIMLTQEGKGTNVNDLVGIGQTLIQILQNALEDAIVLELNDCSIDELLYYMDQGTPVFAKTGANQAVLLTGYTSEYVYYYDPASKQTKTLDYNGIEALFSGGGNYFIVYVK